MALHNFQVSLCRPPPTLQFRLIDLRIHRAVELGELAVIETRLPEAEIARAAAQDTAGYDRFARRTDHGRVQGLAVPFEIDPNVVFSAHRTNHARGRQRRLHTVAPAFRR